LVGAAGKEGSGGNVASMSEQSLAAPATATDGSDVVPQV